MLTKEQKIKSVAEQAEKIKNSKSIIFTDFSGVPTKDIEILKNQLKESNSEYKVVKKRLLKIALTRAGIDFDPLSKTAPIGAIFSPEEITTTAGPVYKFSKDLAKKKISFDILGAYDGQENKVLSDEEFLVIAKLPSREVLLAQIMGGITGPLRAFMSIVKQLSDPLRQGSSEEIEKSSLPSTEEEAPKAPVEEKPAEEKPTEEKPKDTQEAKSEQPSPSSDGLDENKNETVAAQE
jgi:large subunit ribosomal protein L10